MTPAPDADRALLIHIADCIARIFEYTGRDQATFMDSRLVQDAVMRNLQTLAESTQRLSDALKATEPAIPWRDIAGFRNVLTHGYLSLDIHPVWIVIEQDLPGLAQAIARMRQTLEEGTTP
jgi:uncharacterized protein with HEPN domain